MTRRAAPKPRCVAKLRCAPTPRFHPMLVPRRCPAARSRRSVIPPLDEELKAASRYCTLVTDAGDRVRGRATAGHAGRDGVLLAQAPAHVFRDRLRPEYRPTLLSVSIARRDFPYGDFNTVALSCLEVEIHPVVRPIACCIGYVQVSWRDPIHLQVHRRILVREG